jgi:hypothetical protein
MSRPSADDLKRRSGEAAARGLDLLEDPEVVTALEHFHDTTLGLIGTLQVKDMPTAEVASFVGGVFARILHDANG